MSTTDISTQQPHNREMFMAMMCRQVHSTTKTLIPDEINVSLRYTRHGKTVDYPYKYTKNMKTVET